MEFRLTSSCSGDSSKDGEDLKSKQGVYRKEEIDNIDKIDPEQNTNYVYKFLAHTGAVTCISMLYDEQYFLSTGTDNIIKLWYILKL